MFKQQAIILNTSPRLRDILKRYQWTSSPEDWLDVAERESQHFLVTLPFVGAFSAGKSTLINALIETPLFSTNIDPETAYPAELSYGAEEKLVGFHPDGKVIGLTRDQIRDDLSTLLPKGSYVSVALPHPLLASLPHLRMVDMPGWDSGIEAHASAIDSYAARSLAYCVVVSADEGNLRESLRRALRELAVRDMPILAVISKSDKKPPEDVDAIVEQVRQEITAVMGQPPFAAVKVSARKKHFDELIVALNILERQAEQLFAHNVTHTVLAKLRSFGAHVDTLINADDLDSENIKTQCERLNAEMASFATRLEDETRQLETRVQPVLGRIVDRIGNALNEDIETLTSEALHGGDLSGSVGSTVRLAAQKGIAAEFNPEIGRYLNRIVDGLPADFSPEIKCTFDYRTESDGSSPPLVYTPILGVLLPMLKFIPKLNVISTVVLGLASLLEGLFSKSRHAEAEEARQREEAQRKIISSVIPSTLQQVKNALRPILEEHIQSAKQKIFETVQAQQASHASALQELQAKLAEGQAAFAVARASYQSDRNAVNQLIAELEGA